MTGETTSIYYMDPDVNVKYVSSNLDKNKRLVYLASRML